jgi:uncharacterized protein
MPEGRHRKHSHRDHVRVGVFENLLPKLRALYAQTDALMAGTGCDNSTECCRFAVSGREPLPTPLEWELIVRALQSSPLPKRRSLQMMTSERPCPLLRDDLRCGVYSARPFGCRTFFCGRARTIDSGSPVNPLQEHREALRQLGQQIAELSAQALPVLSHGDPSPRAITTWFALGTRSHLA